MSAGPAALAALRGLLDERGLSGSYDDEDLVDVVQTLRAECKEIGKLQAGQEGEWYEALFLAVYRTLPDLIDVAHEESKDALAVCLRDLTMGCLTAHTRAMWGNHAVDWARAAGVYPSLDGGGSSVAAAPVDIGGAWVVQDPAGGAANGLAVPLPEIRAALTAGRGDAEAGRALLLRGGRMLLAVRRPAEGPLAGSLAQLAAQAPAGVAADPAVTAAIAAAAGAAGPGADLMRAVGFGGLPVAGAAAARPGAPARGALGGVGAGAVTAAPAALRLGAPVDGLAHFGYRTGSAIQPGHRRVAAEVLKRVGTSAASVRGFVHSEHRNATAARLGEMDTLAAQVDTMLAAAARAGLSMEHVLADDVLEIALSRLAALDLIERDGNPAGALALQAVSADPYLFSAASREAASKVSRDAHKLKEALGRKNAAAGHGSDGHADKGRGKGGRGTACYLCEGPHTVQDCPGLAAARAAVPK